MGRRFAFAVAFCLALAAGVLAIALSSSGDAHANDGALDRNFGRGGTVLTRFGSHSDDGANAVAVQNDGMIVVAGHTDANRNSDGFAVARYTTSGTIDTSFGTEGTVRTRFGPDESANAAAVQKDGKIVVTGSTWTAVNHERAAVARYTRSGALDTTFGTGGKVLTDIDFSRYSEATAVAIQPDGKIVVAATGSRNSAIVRYTTDGMLDTSFGTGGQALLHGSGISALAIQSDGKIVVAGTRHRGNSSLFELARFTPSGTLDNSFGTRGTVLTDFARNPLSDGSHREDHALAVAIQTDGKIVAAGVSEDVLTGNDDGALARYTSSGTLDPSFGTGGKLLTGLRSRNEAAFDVAIQSDGKILVAADGEFASNTDLLRYTTRGTFDSTFGTGGRMSTRRYIVNAIAIQPDGKIVGAGLSDNQHGTHFALARFLP